MKYEDKKRVGRAMVKSVLRYRSYVWTINAVLKRMIFGVEMEYIGRGVT